MPTYTSRIEKDIWGRAITSRFGADFPSFLRLHVPWGAVSHVLPAHSWLQNTDFGCWLPQSGKERPESLVTWSPYRRKYGRGDLRCDCPDGLAIGARMYFFILFIAPILGIIALKKINESGGREKGHGMAIAGIVVGGLMLFGLLVVALGG